VEDYLEGLMNMHVFTLDWSALILPREHRINNAASKACFVPIALVMAVAYVGGFKCN
jgi:hypothetical protein